MLDRNITPDSQLAATFIKAFSWAGDIAMAHSLFTETLPEWGIKAGLYHYNALMYGYAKEGDWPSVDNLTRCFSLSLVLFSDLCSFMFFRNVLCRVCVGH